MSQPRLFLEVEYVDMSSASEIERLLRKHKIPLERLAIVDTSTGHLYVAEAGQVHSATDPVSCEPIRIPPGFAQRCILNVTLAPDALIDTAFVGSGGELVNKWGNPLTLTPADSAAWVQAVLSATFGNGS